MARELKRIDITDVPDLLRIAEEVRTTQEPRVLRRDSEDVAILVPVQPARRRGARARPVTREDALFRLVGLGRSGIPGGVSAKKHEYLGRAYRPS